MKYTDKELQLIKELYAERKGEDDVIRIEVVLPNDYLALCSEIAELRAFQVKYDMLTRNYGDVVIENGRLRDMLKTVRNYCRSHDIVIPGIKWGCKIC